MTIFNMGSVISAVILSKNADGEMYVACAKKRDDELKVVVIEYDGNDDDNGANVCGLYYAKCKTRRTVDIKKGV